LKALTARIVIIFFKPRAHHSPKKEEVPISVFTTYKEEENLPSMNSNISTNNSNTDSVRNNFGKSFTPLEDTMLKPSPSKNSASTSKKNLPQEKSLSDPFIMYLSIPHSFFLILIYKINQIKTAYKSFLALFHN
jgi:hypothetical protein